ncbi:unnamed protein product [Penicillium salamii]|uniref:Uncharacterized protein n=1 Tax=Penicillium salamii TaxID=1612424 RepID=A0A9W4JSC4_9EURO|nr:unnamed protein product [Penicillium salamii]CAG8302551.1 unnamed protein product [Penicillium salamii]CAG8367394.1 unnamed protein product [Penicillium salamii]CAG8399127.1 unnamed protein product [Penicillium salamii]CAG8408652.1 unnamed protein product [Penicillium salamii]
MSTNEQDRSTAVLAPGDAATLQDSGLASPPYSDGTRRIHKRRLNRSSDEDDGHLPLTPISMDSGSDCFVSIPEDLTSLATLEYIGYNRQTAVSIWQRWNNWPAGIIKRQCDDFENGIPFIEIAEAYLETQPDTCDENDSAWLECLDRYGMSNEFTSAIMDTKFRHIRLTETCQFWAIDTLKLRYRALEEVQEASRQREREQATQRESSRPGTHSPDPPTQRSISDSLRSAPWMSPETAMSSFATQVAANAPGRTQLYKGMDKARISGLFRNDGSIDYECLAAIPPADFTSKTIDIYFGVDREVAVRYACYAKRRSESCSAVIVQVSIPNSVIETLAPPEIQHVYWPTTEWKSLVFLCRQRRKLPSHLRKFKLADLVIGSICNKPNMILANMESPNEITEQMVFKTKDGRVAVQYVFKGEGGDDLLHDSAKLTVFPLTSREIESWRHTS